MHLGIAEPYFAPCRTYTSRDIERYVLEGEIDTRGVRDPDAADLLQRVSRLLLQNRFHRSDTNGILQMLRKRPEERLTMSEILTHPYLTKWSSSLALADHVQNDSKSHFLHLTAYLIQMPLRIALRRHSSPPAPTTGMFRHQLPTLLTCSRSRRPCEGYSRQARVLLHFTRSLFSLLIF